MARSKYEPYQSSCVSEPQETEQWSNMIEDVSDVGQVDLAASAYRRIPTGKATIPAGADMQVNPAGTARRGVLHFRDRDEQTGGHLEQVGVLVGVDIINRTVSPYRRYCMIYGRLVAQANSPAATPETA